MVASNTRLPIRRTTTNTSRSVRSDGLTSNDVSYTQYIGVETTTDKIWSRTPDFARLKKLHQLPDNDYSFVRTIETYPYGWVQQSVYDAPWSSFYTTSGVIPDGERAAVAPIDPVYSRNADDIARTEVLNKIKDVSVNIAQMIAEREQTINLVITTAIRLAKAYSHLKRGDLKGAAGSMGTTYSRERRRRYHFDANENPTRAASNAWLELQYGWRPLLQDVYGLAEQAAKSFGPEIRAEASGKGLYGARSSSAIVKDGNHRLINIETRVKVKYTCRFATDNQSLSLARQIGLTNPLLLGWELLPFSFVVDWFLPIGNWVSSFDATVGLDFRGGTKTVIIEQAVDQKEVRSRPTNYPPRVTAYSGVMESSIRYVSVRRLRLTSFPGPALPTFKSPVSPTHAANAIALLAAIFGRR